MSVENAQRKRPPAAITVPISKVTLCPHLWTTKLANGPKMRDNMEPVITLKTKVDLNNVT